MNAAKCRFCLTFGREARKDGAIRKTNRSRKDDLTFSKRFRADMFSQHHSAMHPSRWIEYNALPDVDKQKYFDVSLPFAETIPSHFACNDKFQVRIAATIIDDVIVKHFMQDSTEHGYRNSFLKLLNRDENDEYVLTISNKMQFDMTVRFVGKGLSFRQAQESVRVAREVGHNPNLNGVTEHVVRQYVQATIAVNLQNIRQMLLDSQVWAYSIAFDAGTNREDSYLDVRLRLCLGAKLSNVHLLAIPMHASHTGELMFNLICQILKALLGPVWDKKLLSVATDGAKNMTGRVQGAVTRFGNVCLPGFFRVWCANHQLDLIVQSVMTTVLQDSFKAPLLAIISFLRRQTTLRSQMGSTCPAVCQTRWMSLGTCTKWLTRHRERIESYMYEKSARCTPPQSWWLMAAAVKCFMLLVDECSTAIQGRDTLVCEQSARLKKLQNDIRSALKMEGPMTGLDLLTVAGEATVAGQISCQQGLLIVRRDAVSSFLEDCSLNAEEDLEGMSLEERDTLENTVSQAFLISFVKIGELCALRNSNNAALEENFPSILPSQVADLRPRDLYNLIRMQKSRLLSTFQASYLTELEDEFRSFKRHVSSTTAARNDADRYSSSFASGGDVFGKAWEPFKTRFKKLVSFFGGLATVFPSTAAVESDFSVLQWEKDVYRQSLTDLSLEGVLHCKQIDALSKQVRRR